MNPVRILLTTLTAGLLLAGSAAAQGQDTSKVPTKEPAAGAITHTNKSVAVAQKIDINSADKDSLMTLKGIGEAYAAAIIKGRPYKRKDELVQRGIIPAATYAKIKAKIVATQSQ